MPVLDRVACTDDVDCDDGVFCNGEETCDADGFCTDGTDPCLADQTCDEDTDSCVSPTLECAVLTLGQDAGASFVAGSGDDCFDAPLVFNPATGTSVRSLQTQDSLDGATGSDSLNVTFGATANDSLTPAVANIETFNITDTSGVGAITTFNAANVTGLQTINNVESTAADVTFTNLANTVDLGITNSRSDFDLTFIADATNGSDDAMTITLDRAQQGCEIDITTAVANGVETINVVSSGDVPNRIDGITETTGTTWATLNISGGQDLTIDNQFDNSVTTFDASSFSGALTLTGGFGSGVINFTGGDGDDTVRFNGDNTFVILVGGAQDQVDGGAGTDELRLHSSDIGDTASVLTSVTNIEQLACTDELNAATTDTTHFGAISQLTLEAGIGTITSITVASGTTIVSEADWADNDAREFIIAGAGADDTLTLEFRDADVDNATQTFTGIETLNLISNLNAAGTSDDGVNTFTGALTLADAPGVGLNISGTEALTFGASITARTINATGFEHDLVMGALTVATGGVTITSAGGDDTLWGSASTDTINTGSGDDTVHPDNGVDAVAFGSGSCTLDLDTQSLAELSDVSNRVTVTGMDIDGQAYTPTNDTDCIIMGNVTDEGDLSNGASGGEIQTVTTPGVAYATVAGQAILELAWAFSTNVDLDSDTVGTTLLTACGATTGTTACTISVASDQDAIIIIAYQDTKAYLYFADEDADGGNVEVNGANIYLFAVIGGNVPVGGFESSNFR